MYESFFNLARKPFDLIPNPEFLYLGKSHKRALTYLDYGIRERAGFILLTGEVGSGKTTIIRNLLKKCEKRVLLARIFNTSVDSVQLLAMINEEFGLSSSGKGKVELLRELNDFLIDQYGQGNYPVLVIDEAQNFGSELLEEVRMLSNLESADSKLLQIILVGQPELCKTLNSAVMVQLRQRISINCHLQPLSPDETEQYILHRLEVAGNRSAVEFAPETLAIIHRFSRGIPRLINIICDFILLAAFAEETRQVTVELVRDILGDLDFENRYWSAEPAGNGSSPGAGFPLHEEITGLVQLLRDMNNRLDTLEKELPRFDREFFDNMAEKIISLQNAFCFHVNETYSSLSELRKAVDRIGATSGAPTLAADEGTGTQRRLLRKIFGE